MIYKQHHYKCCSLPLVCRGNRVTKHNLQTKFYFVLNLIHGHTKNNTAPHFQPHQEPETSLPKNNDAVVTEKQPEDGWEMDDDDVFSPEELAALESKSPWEEGLPNFGKNPRICVRAQSNLEAFVHTGVSGEQYLKQNCTQTYFS